MASKRCVVKNNEGKYLSHSSKSRYCNPKDYWTDNIDKARVFTNLSCAKNSYAMQSDKTLVAVRVGLMEISE